MKKLFVPLLLILSLLLGGCTNKNEARFRAFSEELRARNDAVLTAQVRAEYDDQSCSFTLRCAEDGSGGCTVEVIEPELIRGVRAHMSADGTRLLSDSVCVDTGEGGSSLSPMGALPLLLGALREGALDSVWKEDGCLAVRLVPEDDIGVTVLFDADMRPDWAEIDRAGKTLFFIDVTEFT